jgi:hypothetical protein
MFDGNSFAISHADSGINGAEATLAKDLSNPVSPFKRLTEDLKICK